MSKVILKNITKIYDNKKKVIDNVSLEIQDKEFVVLVGASGCGKSTLLRMIAGLENISDGEIFIDEKKVNDVHPKDRDIAFVFQSYALYPHMTVRENIAFGLKMRNIDKDTIEQKNTLIDASFHKYFRRKMLYDMMLLKGKSTFLVWLYCFCPNVEKVKDRINKRKDANSNNMIKVAENQADSMEIYNHIIETFDLPSIEEVPSQINCAIISFNTDTNTIVKIEKNSELADLDLVVRKICENVTIQQIRWREMK